MKNEKAYSKVIAKAWSDPKFKERLLKDPEHVLKEQGVEMPKGKKIHVHENSDKIVHFVLPAKPDTHLSMGQLKKIAGGETGCFP